MFNTDDGPGKAKGHRYRVLLWSVIWRPGDRDSSPRKYVIVVTPYTHLGSTKSTHGGPWRYEGTLPLWGTYRWTRSLSLWSPYFHTQCGGHSGGYRRLQWRLQLYQILPVIFFSSLMINVGTPVGVITPRSNRVIWGRIWYEGYPDCVPKIGLQYDVIDIHCLNEFQNQRKRLYPYHKCPFQYTLHFRYISKTIKKTT